MDWGKIMFGIGLVMLSVGMLISPSGAATGDRSCVSGCGNTFSPVNTAMIPYSLPGQDIPAGYSAPFCGNSGQGSTP